jgi:predicted trehalose synthase
MKAVHEILMAALEDWKMMQSTDGDEGAEWADRFERHFYECMDELRSWYNHLEKRPQTVEEAEEISEIQDLLNLLPGPLHINFYNELEDIIEDQQKRRYD